MALMPKILRWGPYDDWRGWLRGLIVTLTGATFLAFAGAFNSSRVSAPVRFSYWFGLMILGWRWGACVSRGFFARYGQPKRLWLRILSASIVIAIPYSVVVAFASHLAWGSNFDNLPNILDVLTSVTAVSIIMVTINVLVAGRMGGVASASLNAWIEK